MNGALRLGGSIGRQYKILIREGCICRSQNDQPSVLKRFSQRFSISLVEIGPLGRLYTIWLFSNGITREDMIDRQMCEVLIS